MIRLDVPVKDGNIAAALQSAQEFVKYLNLSLVPEQAAYIFGTPHLHD